eukprot:4565794-Alexandrium_andersonii.AAC.1
MVLPDSQSGSTPSQNNSLQHPSSSAGSRTLDGPDQPAEASEERREVRLAPGGEAGREGSEMG